MSDEQKADEPKKKKEGVFKWVFKDFVSVSRWLHVGWLRESFNRNISSAKNLFTVQEAKTTETFEEAMKRFGLTEDDIGVRAKEFFRLTLIYLTLAATVLLYTLYLAFEGMWAGAMLGLTATLLSLTFAFRQHFWYFQVKNRKLGCTFREWYHSSIVSGEDKNEK